MGSGRGSEPLADKNYNPNGKPDEESTSGKGAAALPVYFDRDALKRIESGGAVSAWHVLLV